ncbi:MAG: hypothetical protein A2X35_08150 [Elusimicrobia bacterium GWA2_61_42]|nr:MAG: hypothetical protein A2X35_08150 [Elusimicrobia bacterium GWA2_61_42]OGR79952.1 MAG: hypothetical protein A2X38_02035 [Elusimicrobia bacterium GWC2_61_25]
MAPAALYALYAACLGAFAVNAWFLGVDLAGWVRSGKPKSRLLTALLLAAAFGLGQAAYSGVSPRGGYDNDHDFQYLGMSFFNLSDIGFSFSGKEVSPVIADAVFDSFSGRSLPFVLVKNELLMFAAAVLLFAFFRRCGLGAAAAFFGFFIFYFNFLAALNARTFSTTAANVFYICSALYAAASLDEGRRGLAGLAWALCAFFLVCAGRYEMAALPALFLAASLLRPGGGLRRLVSPGGRPAAAWALLAGAAALCAVWLAEVAGRYPYNGPSAREALRLGGHFMEQLWKSNLSIGLHVPAAAVFPAVAGAFVLVAWRALAAGDGRRLFCAAALLAGALYLSSVFSVQAEYPLHFMRHQLYFFLLFACLAAFAWEALWRPGYEKVGLAALIVFCGIYLGANASAAAGLEGEKRTNDLEWRLLLEARAKWPTGCALVYGQHDHRKNVLKKYFPLLSGDCAQKEPACVYKYIPAHCQVFSGPEAGRPQDCVLPWLPGGGSAAPALAEAGFPHRFYTMFRDAEARQPLPVRIGFYRADKALDKALFLRQDGLCSLKSGDLPVAERRFRQALALAPDCAECGLDLAWALALRGDREAVSELKKMPHLGPAGQLLPLASALSEAAAGNDAEALARLQKFNDSGRGGRHMASADAYGQALRRRGRVQGKGQ